MTSKDKAKNLLISKDITYGIIMNDRGFEINLTDLMIEYAQHVQSDWISVEDRLPKKGELMLCYSKSEGIVSDSYDWATHSNDCIYFNGTKDDYRVDITHWQPLPQPPPKQ